MILHKPHEAGEPDPLKLNKDAEQILQAADVIAYHFTAGNIERSLQAVCDLRSRCDYLARELVRLQFSPMEKARLDLARILAAKAVRNG